MRDFFFAKPRFLLVTAETEWQTNWGTAADANNNPSNKCSENKTIGNVLFMRCYSSALFDIRLTELDNMIFEVRKLNPVT